MTCTECIASALDLHRLRVKRTLGSAGSPSIGITRDLKLIATRNSLAAFVIPFDYTRQEHLVYLKQ
jgi:hypothetical protein